MVEEKVQLLSDLQHAGLRADQYADFLFFGFHGSRDIDIDVIAAATTPMRNNARPEEFLDLFVSMGSFG